MVDALSFSVALSFKAKNMAYVILLNESCSWTSRVLMSLIISPLSNQGSRVGKASRTHGETYINSLFCFWTLT